MEGLELANRLSKPEGRAELQKLVDERVAKLGEAPQKTARPAVSTSTERSPSVEVVPARPAPDLEPHELALRLHELWPYLNPQRLYTKQLGLQGNVPRLVAQ